MRNSNVTILNEKLSDLPDDVREKVARYISEHLEDIQDDLKWEESFRRTSQALTEFAKKARIAIQEGKAEEIDFTKL